MPKMNKIYIVGIGAGTREYLLPVALKHIKAADCLIGVKRTLAEFKNLHKEEFPLECNLGKIIPFVKKEKDKKRIAILVSGDPCLYSFLDTISRKLKKGDYEVIPGISSMQVAFARIGESWQDALIISLHGRKITEKIIKEIKNGPKVFIFTDNHFTPNAIAALLLKKGVKNRRAVVFENLGYPKERIVDTTLKGLCLMNGFGFCVMIIL